MIKASPCENVKPYVVALNNTPHIVLFASKVIEENTEITFSPEFLSEKALDYKWELCNLYEENDTTVEIFSFEKIDLTKKLHDNSAKGNHNNSQIGSCFYLLSFIQTIILQTSLNLKKRILLALLVKGLISTFRMVMKRTVRIFLMLKAV